MSPITGIIDKVKSIHEYIVQKNKPLYVFLHFVALLLAAALVYTLSFLNGLLISYIFIKINHVEYNNNICNIYDSHTYLLCIGLGLITGIFIDFPLITVLILLVTGIYLAITKLWICIKCRDISEVNESSKLVSVLTEPKSISNKDSYPSDINFN